MATTDRLGATVDATEAPSSSTPNAGIAIKTAVRAATTGTPIALSGLQTIDAVSLNAGDRVLVKDQSDPTTNGIYNVSSGQWAAANDFQNNTQVARGLLVVVAPPPIGSNQNGGSIWQLTTADPVVLGSSPITFVLQSVSPLVGVLPIAAGGTGASTAAGAVANLFGVLPIADGGTGASTAAAAVANLGLRERLAANRTYYVRPDTGLDTNNGLQPGTPFKTVQHAIDTVANAIDLNGFTVLIDATCSGQFSGTYTENLLLRNYVTIGDGNQTTVVVSYGSCTVQPPNNSIAVLSAGVSSCWTFSGGTWTCSGGVLFFSDIEGFIAVANADFGACGQALAMGNTGKIELLDSAFTISGSMTAFVNGSSHATFLCQPGVTFTLSGTPNFSNAFLLGAANASFNFSTTTFTGSATGAKYSIDSTCSILTSNGGGNPNSVLPGDVNGVLFGVGNNGTPLGWTPTDASGAGLTFSNVDAGFMQLGSMVFIFVRLTYPSTANTNAAVLQGLPIAVPNRGYGNAGVGPVSGTTYSAGVLAQALQNSFHVQFVQASGGGGSVTNANLSGQTVSFSLFYPQS